MFNIILWLCKSFLSIIGSIMFGIILIVLFGSEIAEIFACFLLGLLVSALLFAGMFFDYKLRKKYNLLHKKEFSLLWTIVSVIELSVFAVFVIITMLGLIPVIVLICDVIIYMLLSVLILFSKIKKLENNID